MHLGFILYSFYTVLGKIASSNEFLSFRYCLFYGLLLLILFAYALLWQQVLKCVSLSVATANKASVIIWGMLWSRILFKEEITLKKLIGASVIIFGIFILSFSGKVRQSETEVEH